MELLKKSGIHNAYRKFIGKLSLEEIFTTDSVYIAAYRCSIGFMNRADTQAFMQSPMQNARVLCKKVLSGRFVPRYYTKRIIIERGKAREIMPPTFECKVVQKVFCGYLIRQLFEDRMISTNYASIKGRGTEALYQDVLVELKKSLKNPGAVIVIMDFKSYFASILIEILRQNYAKYVKDERIVNLICSFSPNERGLSLGNESSQVPASFFPSSIDHYFKDRLGLESYNRYMDDTLFIVQNMEQAKAYVEIFQSLADSIGLTIPAKKIQLIKIGQNFVFCKERFIYNKKCGDYYRLINPAIPRGEIRKIRYFKHQYDTEKMTEEEITLQVKGCLGMVRSRPGTGDAIRRIETEYLKIFPENRESIIINRKPKVRKEKGEINL